MRQISAALGLACLGAFILATGVPLAQSAGSIVGWGAMVVVEPEALEALVSVAGGDSHSLGVRSDGTVVAWGNNWYSQCNVPPPNAGLFALAAGGEQNLGLKVPPVSRVEAFFCATAVPGEGVVLR